MKQNNVSPLLKYVGISLIVIVSPIFLFQNCSQFSNPSAKDSSSHGFQTVAAADANHPVEEQLSPPTKQIRIANRRYMQEIFRSIYTSENGTKAPGLDTFLYNWFERRGAQLGGPCDMNDSLTLADCNEDPSSSSLPVHGDPNAVRESFKIQVCEELNGTSEGLGIALGNAGLSMAELPDPTFENMKPIYELFYRSDEAPAYILQTMSQLSVDLKSAGESKQNIWRGLILLVCESPEWQRL